MHVDPAKYLLIRLCLRKPGKWHRLSSLRYQHELGEDITTVVERLCVSSKPYTIEEHAIKQEEREIIDLTLDGMQLQDLPPAPLLGQPKAEAGPSSIKIEDISEQPCEDLSFFAQDHTHAGLHELLECLSLEELKQLAKDMRIRKPSMNVSYLPTWVLMFDTNKDTCTEGSARGPTDQTCILPIYFTISFKNNGGKAAPSTCTIIPR
jgi:hypothetical protein